MPRPSEPPPAKIFALGGVFSMKTQFKRMVASHIILHAARLCRIPPQKSHTRSRFLSPAHVRFYLRGAFSPRSRMPAHSHARFRVISLPHKFVFIRARSSHMLSYIFARAMTIINTKKEKTSAAPHCPPLWRRAKGCRKRKGQENTRQARKKRKEG